eukprot:6864205-Lingulodinium_polyedra.AAC.1
MWQGVTFCLLVPKCCAGQCGRAGEKEHQGDVVNFIWDHDEETLWYTDDWAGRVYDPQWADAEWSERV